jgi:phosphotransferase system enzyme I (PtsI)
LAKNDTMWEIEGIAASPGIAIGHIMHIRENFYKCCRLANGSQEMKEKERFLTARQAAEIELTALERETAKVIDGLQAEVFGIQKVMLTDISLVNSILTDIKQHHVSAEVSVENTINEIAAMLTLLDNDYMLERAGHIKAIGNRLLRILQGITEKVSYRCILVAHDWLPFHGAVLDLDNVSGYITALGSKNSQSSMLAQAGIPAVIGIGSTLEKLENGDMVIVDGYTGHIVVNPEEWIIAEYEQRIKRNKANLCGQSL